MNVTVCAVCGKQFHALAPVEGEESADTCMECLPEDGAGEVRVDVNTDLRH